MVADDGSKDKSVEMIEKFKKESNSTPGNMCELGFSYNSETNKTFLTVENLKKLILDPKKLWFITGNNP